MEPSRRVQIHQYNDPEILEFFNEHHVNFRLVGDHLFIIRSHGQDVAAGPGDWLRTAADGEVDVERGDYRRRAQQAIRSVRRARATLPEGSATRSPLADRTSAPDGSVEQAATRVPESGTEEWKRRVEAEARNRLRRHIRRIVDSR